MDIEIGGRTVTLIRVCEECDGSYTKGIEPNADEWEDILAEAEEGRYIITEDVEEITVRASYFVCPDCANSTHMDQIDGDQRELPADDGSDEVDGIKFPHPFILARFNQPKKEDEDPPMKEDE